MSCPIFGWRKLPRIVHSQNLDQNTTSQPVVQIVVFNTSAQWMKIPSVLWSISGDVDVYQILFLQQQNKQPLKTYLAYSLLLVALEQWMRYAFNRVCCQNGELQQPLVIVWNALKLCSAWNEGTSACMPPLCNRGDSIAASSPRVRDIEDTVQAIRIGSCSAGNCCKLFYGISSATPLSRVQTKDCSSCLPRRRNQICLQTVSTCTTGICWTETTNVFGRNTIDYGINRRCLRTFGLADSTLESFNGIQSQWRVYECYTSIPEWFRSWKQFRRIWYTQMYVTLQGPSAFQIPVRPTLLRKCGVQSSSTGRGSCPANSRQFRYCTHRDARTCRLAESLNEQMIFQDDGLA